MSEGFATVVGMPNETEYEARSPEAADIAHAIDCFPPDIRARLHETFMETIEVFRLTTATWIPKRNGTRVLLTPAGEARAKRARQAELPPNVIPFRARGG
jgi:hypothetical protein